MRRGWAAAAAVAVLTATAALGVPAPSVGSADGIGTGPRSGPTHRDDATRVRRVTVNWDGAWRNPKYVKTAVVPGIGQLALICKPHDTRVRLYTPDREYETQMWLQKYEIKDGRRVVSVKVPRIYRYAHADDDGTGGTGFYAHEGLNQRGHIENRSQDGYMYGVISQRPGRHQSGAAVSPPPVTTFELTWFWNGFDHPQRYRSCRVDAVLTTHLDDRAVLTWHGHQDPAPLQQTRWIPGIGELTLSCPRTGAPRDRALWIRPESLPASLYVETVTGEGVIEHHVEESDVDVDPTTGLLGPVRLPNNGSLRVLATSGTTSHWLLVSSYWIVNDKARPQRNLCEVAAGYYDR